MSKPRLTTAVRRLAVCLLPALFPAPLFAGENQLKPDVISDVWTEVGETSAAISCMTSTPCNVHVEYGPAPACRSATTPDEGYGWVHLARLTGLTPGTRYHCRIVAVSENGRAWRSEPMILKPTRWDDAIRVPGDLPGPPYVLDRAGATYVLTEDVQAEGTALKITASRVRLHLDGYTVRYGRKLGWTDPEQKQSWQGTGHGVHVPGWGTKGVAVLGGVICEASAKQEAHPQGFGHNPVMAEGSTDLELAGITAVYSGKDIRGFCLHNCKRAHVHHCVVNDLGTQITNRHQGLDAIVSPPGSEIHHNLVPRVRHRGINGADDCEIHHNEIHLDSYATNAFGVMLYRCAKASAHHNYVLGGGYHAIGIGTVSGCSNVRVFDNHIRLVGTEPSDRWPEYGRMSGMNGVRVTWGGENLEYAGNTIIVTGTGGSRLRGTWFSSDDKLRNLVFRNNTVRVVAEDEKTGASAIAVCGDYNAPEHHPVIYRDNTIISNTCNVRLGESYGLGRNTRFISNCFVREGQDPRYATIRIGYWDKPTTGHVFRDSRFEGGAGLAHVRFEAAGPRDLTVQWSAEVHLRDRNAKPLADAEVRIADRRGNTVFTGNTDRRGAVRAVLTEYVHTPEGKSHRTPHTISVNLEGFQPLTKTIQIRGKRTLQLTLHRT